MNTEVVKIEGKEDEVVGSVDADHKDLESHEMDDEGKNGSEDSELEAEDSDLSEEEEEEEGSYSHVVVKKGAMHHFRHGNKKYHPGDSADDIEEPKLTKLIELGHVERINK